MARILATPELPVLPQEALEGIWRRGLKDAFRSGRGSTHRRLSADFTRPTAVWWTAIFGALSAALPDKSSPFGP